MPPLDGAFARVDRADKHLTDLMALQDSYRLDHVHTITIYKHPQLGYVPRIEAAGPPVPMVASILCGEAIYNLRAALDYLVYELAALDSGSAQDRTQFPIEDTKELFASRRESRLKGVGDNHVTPIEWLQPYNGVFWTKTLRDISNPDKHSRLTGARTGISANGNVTHGPKGTFAGWRGAVYQAPDDPNIDVHVDFDVTFDLALEDGRAVVYLLDELHTEVRQALVGFEPCFRGECPHHGWPWEPAVP